MASARERLRELVKSQAVKHGDFVLSSGRRARFYIDLRLVTLSAEGSALVGQAMLDLLGDDPVDAVGGMTVAADPVVTAMALTSHLRASRPLAALIVRKEAKQHGLSKQVEGPLQVGMKVVVVDDTFTTGGSALQAAAAIEAAGCTVGRILGIVDRGEGARAAIEATGRRFDCLYTLADLGLG